MLDTRQQPGLFYLEENFNLICYVSGISKDCGKHKKSVNVVDTKLDYTFM